jgi:hypothetical protein
VVESLSVAARVGDLPRMRAVLAPLPALIKHRHGFRAAIVGPVGPAIFNVGASSAGAVGAARIEIIAGSKLQSIGAVKVETIGGALIQETGSPTVDPGGPLAHTVGGTPKQAITGTHTVTAAKMRDVPDQLGGFPTMTTIDLWF